MHLVETPATQCVAAADAFASSTCAGIGGWWMPNDAQLAVSSICWFSMSLDKSSLPAEGCKVAGRHFLSGGPRSASVAGSTATGSRVSHSLAQRGLLGGSTEV